VDYFYAAAKRRSQGALWPIFAPALTPGRTAIPSERGRVRFAVAFALGHFAKDAIAASALTQLSTKGYPDEFVTIRSARAGEAFRGVALAPVDGR
jgi:hypothetical protein